MAETTYIIKLSPTGITKNDIEELLIDMIYYNNIKGIKCLIEKHNIKCNYNIALNIAMFKGNIDLSIYFINKGNLIIPDELEIIFLCYENNMLKIKDLLSNYIKKKQFIEIPISIINYCIIYCIHHNYDVICDGLLYYTFVIYGYLYLLDVHIMLGLACSLKRNLFLYLFLDKYRIKSDLCNNCHGLEH
jgi:hypothetical protein